jgi:hypothetical protein
MKTPDGTEIPPTGKSFRLYFGPDGSGREVRILGMGLMSWYGRRRP